MEGVFGKKSRLRIYLSSLEVTNWKSDHSQRIARSRKKKECKKKKGSLYFKMERKRGRTLLQEHGASSRGLLLIGGAGRGKRSKAEYALGKEN